MNLPFDAFTGAEFIKELSADIVPLELRQAQAELNVPCISELGGRLLALLAAIKQPKTIIDIGCGIGASTLALAQGAPNAHIMALDANEHRAELCSKFTHKHNVCVHHANALDWLKETDESFDMAFVDSVKKDYSAVWHLLHSHMNKGGLVIFDDVLLHGYTMEEAAQVPLKYRDGAQELRLFLQEITAASSYISQLIPLAGGMLVLSKLLD